MSSPSSAQLLFDPFKIWTNPSTGAVLVGGQLFSYISGTTTPQATYADETAGTPNSNPVVFNSEGQANVWIGVGLSYKFVLEDSLGNTLGTVDNVAWNNANSITLNEINTSAMAGNGLVIDNVTGAFDVNPDNETIEITDNEITIKSVPVSLIPTTSLLEVVKKYVRDLSNPGTIIDVPQYEWTSPILLGNPVTIPPGAAVQCAWSQNGEFLAVISGTSTYLQIYQISGRTTGTFVLTLLSTPSSLPQGVPTNLAWSPCGDFLAVTCYHTPYILIYQRVGNAFNLLPTPASIPTSHLTHPVDCTGLAWSPNSDFLFVSWISDGVDGIIMYERGGTGVGTFSGTGSGTITGTANLSTGAVTGTCSTTDSGTTADTQPAGTTFTDVTTTSTLSAIVGPAGWSPDSSMFAAVSNAAGATVNVYTRADNVFSTLTGVVVTSTLTDVYDFAFSPDGNFLAICGSQTPFIEIYQITSGTFTVLSSPSTLPPGTTSCVAWSANSEYLFVGDASGTSPYMTIYKQTGTIASPVFTAQSAPGVVPAGAVLSAAWTDTKQFLAVVSATTPYLQVYQSASTLPSNALLWSREAPLV